MLLELNFSKNLRAIKEINNTLADKILQVKSNDRFELFEKNYDIYDHKSKSFCVKNSLENLSFFEKNYQRHPFLIFFGMGNGLLINELLKNPLKDHICVVEVEVEILYIALHLSDFSQNLREKRLQIHLSEDVDFHTFYNFFSQEKIQFFIKTYDLLTVSQFYEHYEQDIAKINSLCLQSIKSIATRQGNSTEDSLEGIAQALANLNFQIKNPSLKDLLDARKAKNKNAIIVSTGPSLNKQLALLKQIQNKASILCADTAYPILAKHGIVPDYVLALERHDLVYKCFTQEFKIDEKVLFIISSVVHKSTIDSLEKTNKNYLLIHRPLPFFKALKMDDYGYLGNGMSVANMAYELALALKHENIILIGQDLAYGEDGNSHTKDYLHGTNYENDRKQNLYIKAYGGNGEVETNAFWALFKENFERDILQAKDLAITTYNATEGGARIEGAIEKPFKELCEELLKEQDKNLNKVEKKNPFNTPINQILDDILIMGENYIKECQNLYTKISQSLENNDFNNEIFNPLSQEIFNLKAKFQDENFRNYFLDLIRSLFFHFEYVLAQNYVKNPTNLDEELAKRKEYLELHKNWLELITPHIKIELDTIRQARQ